MLAPTESSSTWNLPLHGHEQARFMNSEMLVSKPSCLTHGKGASGSVCSKGLWPMPPPPSFSPTNSLPSASPGTVIVILGQSLAQSMSLLSNVAVALDRSFASAGCESAEFSNWPPTDARTPGLRAHHSDRSVAGVSVVEECPIDCEQVEPVLVSMLDISTRTKTPSTTCVEFTWVFKSSIESCCPLATARCRFVFQASMIWFW
jgi:hypothetical protein